MRLQFTACAADPPLPLLALVSRAKAEDWKIIQAAERDFVSFATGVWAIRWLKQFGN